MSVIHTTHGPGIVIACVLVTLAVLAAVPPTVAQRPPAATTTVFAVIAAGGDVIATADTANAAGAAKPGTTDSGLQLSSVDRERMARQKPLIAAADIIQAAVDKDMQANRISGYSSIALGESSVVLRWKGALPRAVEAAVEQAREDVGVEVVGARHTNAQMQAKAAQVQQATKNLAGGVPFAVWMPIEGDKVRVEVEGDVITKVTNGLAALDLPVQVTYGAVQEPAGRLNDSAPFSGGGRILGPKSCTSGFAVTNSYGSYLVTAGHCGSPGDVYYNGNRSQLVGTPSQQHGYYDLLLIPAASSGYVINDRRGGYETTMKVNGWGHPYHNEYVCTSGSYTGEVCGVQVDTSSAYGYCDAGECYGGMYRAYQRAGLRAVQSGDSGGPVYNYNRSAMGIISGQGNNGRTVIFQDFHTINQIWGVVPL